MTKREFVDKTELFELIENTEAEAIKKGVDILTITENEILVPYITRLKEQLKQDIQNGLIQVSKGNEKLFADIDELLGQDDADYTAETEEEKEM